MLVGPGGEGGGNPYVERMRLRGSAEVLEESQNGEGRPGELLIR